MEGHPEAKLASREWPLAVGEEEEEEEEEGRPRQGAGRR